MTTLDDAVREAKARWIKNHPGEPLPGSGVADPKTGAIPLTPKGEQMQAERFAVASDPVTTAKETYANIANQADDTQYQLGYHAGYDDGRTQGFHDAMDMLDYIQRAGYVVTKKG
jgi:hypothetical protein